MKLIYDSEKLKGAVYDERGFARCKCGKHFYPSKKMFIDFLRNFKDVDAEAEIWSTDDLNEGKITITVELSYFISDAKIK